ncbi:nuclear pore glycoprotein p62 [Tamandua tetradactyla]|uniref:nuclear pore glycoprotein p62 n=1 Tax=Tamandua tetradactyla TaxID=48850 RepID=UPI0040538C01
MSGFNFGGAGAPAGGFTFGTAKTATTTPTTGFSFSTTGTGGFNFGTPSQPATSAPPSSLFSLTTQAPATQTPGFSFGSATPASSGTGFSLGMNAPKLSLSGTATTQATVNPSGLGLGGSSLISATPSAAAPSASTSGQGTAPTGFVFGSSATSAVPSTTAGSFSFTGGNTSQTGSTGFSIGSLGASAQPTALSGLPFSLAPPTTTGASTGQPAALALTTASAGPTLFASIATAPTSSTTTSLSLCAPATTTGTPAAGTLGFGLKAPGTTSSTATTTSASSAAATTAATTTTTTSFALNLKPLAPTGLSGSTPATITAPPPGPVAAAGLPASPAMTYAQLESLINKWSLELEDQERHFLQQATQVNAWDRTLIENGEKITTLHREVEKVKLDQRRLDQELDFILSQQKELEDLLSPLEESAKEQSGTIYLQHADEEREKTYKLAENIDAQLKRMAQDLKDIIEHLNTAGGPADTNDPLQQICKILNAHMDSLQWVDQNSALLQRKVEEVTKVCEGRRKEQERGYRITFD